MKNIKLTYKISAIVLALFGLLTLFLSSSIIFDWFGIRAKEGNYVLFIVWANFISSILYLVAVAGFLKGKNWTFWPLVISVVVLISAFIGLQFHIQQGGIYEEKTVNAMVFRILITVLFSVIAYFSRKKTIE